MTVRLEEDRIILEGRCRVEDAEMLLSALQQAPQSTVDIGAAETIHSAIIQIILATRPSVEGVEKHEFLRRHAILEPDPR